MLDKGRLQLVGFGFYSEQFRNTQIPQGFYTAPEVFDTGYDPRSDVWSAGVILYLMLCNTYVAGKLPFQADTRPLLIQQIRKGTPSFNDSSWKDVSKDAKNLVKSLLESDPRRRLTAAEAAQHPWFAAPKAMLRQSLTTLQSFHISHTIEAAVYYFLAHHAACSGEQAELTTLFASLDRNGDGKLSSAEILAGRRLAGVPLSELSRLIDICDTDRTGYIDFAEFLC